MRKTLTALCAAFALGGFALMMGCGSGQGPLSSDPGTAISEDAQTGIVAAKPTKKTTSTTDASTTETTALSTAVTYDSATMPDLKFESITKYVSSWDEALAVKFRKYGAETDVTVKKVSLYIHANSIVGGGEYRITMGVYSGTTLDDVNIEFDPSGLEFLPEATMTITLLGPVTAEEVMEAQHIYGDGTVESITTEIDRKGNSALKVVVKVPGFSRYSLGIGD